MIHSSVPTPIPQPQNIPGPHLVHTDPAQFPNAPPPDPPPPLDETNFLPTPPPEPTLPAAQATVYIPTPIHPDALAYAHTRFGRVIGGEPGVDGMGEMGEVDQLVASGLADGVSKSSL